VPLGIAAQPLAQALNDLARQTRLELMVQPALVAGRTAPAVSGLLTPREALDRLLAGSGLVAVIEGTAITVQRIPVPAAGMVPTGSTTLSEVRVTAASERSGLTENSGSYTTRQAGTATPLGLSLRETPQSVSVITRQRMEDQGLTQLPEVVAQTPGLVVSQSGNQGSDSSPIYSRGFIVNTYMIDGVRQTDSNYSSIFQTNDMAMFDRVEVVRGASGLMNGVGTPGAAINLIRKRPSADFQAQVRAEAGSWNHVRGEVDISSPLNASGSVRGRLVAAAQDNDSYIDRLKERKKLLYGVIEADLGTRTQLLAGASVQHHDATGHARGGLPGFYADGTRTAWSRSASAAPPWAYSERHYTSVFAALEHRFNDDWKLKTTATRTTNSYDELIGYASGGAPVRETGAGVTLWAGRWAGKPRQDSLDVQATGRFDLLGRKHDLAFGAQLSRTSYVVPGYTNWTFPGWSSTIGNIYTWDGNSPVSPPNPAVSLINSNERLNSAYATVRFKPADSLALLAGARVVDWSRYQTSTRFSTNATTVTDRGESGEVAPYLGAVYDIDRNWSAYASYTSIFTPQNLRLANGDYMDPQTGDSFELGIKGAFLNERLNVSGAIYKARQDNLGVAIPNVFAPDGSQAYQAVSGTSTRGFEMEVSGEVQPGWQVSAGFSRNITHDRLRARLNTAVPQNTAKLFTSYRIAGIGRGLTVGGGVRWQNQIYTDNLGAARARFTQPAYAVVDLMARYAVTDTVAVTANIGNVFDKVYYTTTGNSYYGTPRSLRMGVDVRF
jgi:outer membrane receptor for ferric coprogen and ferric-rhodotorulic acid